MEDIIEGRIFWPEEVWNRYTARLDNFRDPAYTKEAVHCLNHLITNALGHIPDCLEVQPAARYRRRLILIGPPPPLYST